MFLPSETYFLIIIIFTQFGHNQLHQPEIWARLCTFKLVTGSEASAGGNFPGARAPGRVLCPQAAAGLAGSHLPP